LLGLPPLPTFGLGVLVPLLFLEQFETSAYFFAETELEVAVVVGREGEGGLVDLLLVLFLVE
jgi:hypothetical protein